VLLILILPWRWYQTIYDPPGDTLMGKIPIWPGLKILVLSPC